MHQPHILCISLIVWCNARIHRRRDRLPELHGLLQILFPVLWAQLSPTDTCTSDCREQRDPRTLVLEFGSRIFQSCLEISWSHAHVVAVEGCSRPQKPGSPAREIMSHPKRLRRGSSLRSGNHCIRSKNGNWKIISVSVICLAGAPLNLRHMASLLPHDVVSTSFVHVVQSKPFSRASSVGQRDFILKGNLRICKL